MILCNECADVRCMVGSSDIGFSAEHGCFLKLLHKELSHTASTSSEDEPNGAHEKNEWIDIQKEKGMDISWIPNVLSLMKEFCSQCPGSAIEKKNLRPCMALQKCTKLF